MPRQIVEEWAIFVGLSISGILLALYMRTYILAAMLVALLIWVLVVLARDVKRHKKEDK